MKTYNHVTTFYILRHAEAENNIKDIIGADSDLTEAGKMQAEFVAKQLNRIHFDIIFSSDLLRAKHTAEIIAHLNGNKVITKRELRERNYGKYEGMSMKKYKEKMSDISKKMETMTDDELKIFRRYESFETDQELMDRFISSLKNFAIQYNGGNILIVTHGLVIRTLLIFLKFATYKSLPVFSVKNTGYLKLQYDNRNYVLKKVVDIEGL